METPTQPGVTFTQEEAAELLEACKAMEELVIAIRQVVSYRRGFASVTPPEPVPRPPVISDPPKVNMVVPPTEEVIDLTRQPLPVGEWGIWNVNRKSFLCFDYGKRKVPRRPGAFPDFWGSKGWERLNQHVVRFQTKEDAEKEIGLIQETVEAYTKVNMAWELIPVKLPESVLTNSSKSTATPSAP